MILEHVGRLQVFVVDGVIGANQGQRRFVVEIHTLATHSLVRLGK